MKVQWNNFGLRAPADDYMGGGGGYDDEGDEIIDGNDLDNEDDDDDDDIDDDDDDDSGDGKNSSQRGRNAAPVFDPNQLADAITRGLKPAFEQNKPQLSREDIEKQLGKPQLTTDLIKAIRDPETPPEKALEAMQHLMNQQAEYLLRASGLAIEGKIGELNPKLAEVQEAIRSQREESFATGVVKKFPALRGKGHVVKQAMRILQQQGYNPASASDALRTVGRTARDIIRQIDPNFSLKGKQGLSFAAPRTGGGGRNSGGQQNRRGSRSLMDSVFPVG
jgi:hypothetical protein